MSCRLSNLTEGRVSDIVAIDVKGWSTLCRVTIRGRRRRTIASMDLRLTTIVLSSQSSSDYSGEIGGHRVLVPLFDEHVRHWLLLQVDLHRRCMCVYDSLPPTKAKDMQERKLCIDRAVKISSLHHSPLMPRPRFSSNLKVAIALAVMKTDIYTDALTWDLVHVDYPQQDNGHDCGVFVMIFIDLLALIGHTMCFDQSDIRILWDKCLADILRGTIWNFPVCTWLTDLICHGRLHVRVWYSLSALCPTHEAW
ncbi:hypothetical protein Cgig2_007082 [Carnegiea gigantea]|uniref:Ubiquitin-like protease family profile domain-containing protein n=1 Tax=Carnegiea gigantea TaxID=171969 RepID=A0A9Q1GMP3_9CARY|nr:hypothetical protein Cgig2_007082 [Carnegiea gigantea]